MRIKRANDESNFSNLNEEIIRLISYNLGQNFQAGHETLHIRAGQVQQVRRVRLPRHLRPRARGRQAARRGEGGAVGAGQEARVGPHDHCQVRDGLPPARRSDLANPSYQSI